MGLGGLLTWTATAREIYKKYNKKCFPVEGSKFVDSIIFKNNPNFSNTIDGSINLDLSNEKTNYCIKDFPDRAIHRSDKHIIEIQCEYYNIKNPVLKCEIFFTDEEIRNIEMLKQHLPNNFLIIEPNSKSTYSVNRQYPIEKWQKIINSIKKDIDIIQVGLLGGELLDGVIDLRGKTTFREACLLINYAKLFLSSEGGLVHGATNSKTKSIVILGGYLSKKLIEYPQNIYVDTATHGPCGMKKYCELCMKDMQNYNYEIIIDLIRKNI